MTPPEKMRALNADPEFRRAHRDGQRRRWGLDGLSEEQLATYFHLRRRKGWRRGEALEFVQ
jgi:hypothetical protein